jgi:hypothetical protein
MTYPIDSPSFRLFRSSGPRGEVLQNSATRLTTGTSGGIKIDTYENGRVDSGHPIDQGVALSLTVRLGSVRSAPGVGNALHEVDPYAPSAESDVRKRVLAAYPLSRYLADGSVTIKKIEFETRKHGGLLVSVQYTNERLGRSFVATN